MANFIKLPNGALGANIAQMETLSSTLRTSVDQLDAIFKQIDAKVGATTWAGNDANKAEAQWNTTRQQTMNSLRTMLTTMSSAIKAQATQQTTTSQG
jgi:hypothetical protein